MIVFRRKPLLGAPGKSAVGESIRSMRDTRKNVLPKFIQLWMDMPCLCPFQEHQYDYKTFKQTTGTMIPQVYVGSLVI